MPGFAVAAGLLAVAAALPPGRAEEVDAIFAEFAKPGIPGCAVGVVHDGALVLARGYGQANLEWANPNDPRTVFDTGSIAKQFTAAAIHLLALDGLLSLDDDVRRWIPELQDTGHRVTLRHLLHHTGGLRGGVFGLVHLPEGAILSEAEVLAMYARQRGLLFPPGSAFAYSNTGYFLLGIAAKRAAGKPLGQVAAERLFGPLGMADTRYLDGHAQVIPRRASGYEPAGEGRFRLDTELYETVGAGGVLSTIEDLARWQRNLEAPTPATASLVEAMLEPGRLTDGTRLHYGSGLMLRELGGQPVVRHRGLSGSGFRADVLWAPRRALHVLALCNHGGAQPWSLAEKVFELWTGPLPEPGTGVAPEPEAATAARAGVYRDPANGIQVRITVRDGKVHLGNPWFGTELVHLGGDEYLFPDRTWEARLTIDGRRLRWMPVLGRPAVMERLEPVRPTPSELRRWVGRYHSTELETDWEISLDEGRPVLRIGGGPARPLSPGARGELVSGSIALRIEPGRGPAGGFRVFSWAVSDLLFERAAERSRRPSPPAAASSHPR